MSYESTVSIGPQIFSIYIYWTYAVQSWSKYLRITVLGMLTLHWDLPTFPVNNNRLVCYFYDYETSLWDENIKDSLRWSFESSGGLSCEVVVRDTVGEQVAGRLTSSVLLIQFVQWCSDDDPDIFDPTTEVLFTLVKWLLWQMF